MSTREMLEWTCGRCGETVIKPAANEKGVRFEQPKGWGKRFGLDMCATCTKATDEFMKAGKKKD